MSDPLSLAQARLLEPGGLDLEALQRNLGEILAQPGIDFADLYFESVHGESWSLEDGRIKDGRFHIDQGVGVRAISGEKSALAYADVIAAEPLTEAARAVRAISRQGQHGRVAAWQRSQTHPLYPDHDPVHGLEEADKLAILTAVDQAARAADPAVTQVMATLAGSYTLCLVAASDGTLAADIRPLVRLSVTVIAERDGRREQGFAGAGGRHDYQIFLDDDHARPRELAREAARQALVNLEAVPAPAGNLTVVLGPGWPGVLLHEAVGHGLEGDFIRKGSSAFTGRIGERVASEHCTVVDDGTLEGRRGSLTLDDEGTPSQRTVLIENGILKGYMHDKHNARLMGVAPTGNGRRESFAHLPLPRMTNTFMLPGEHAPEEIIASVKHGLYAANFGGGQVDITSGKFVFSASEAYLIENGRLTRPVKGATLIGNGPDVLTRVSMVGGDLSLDPGIGTCGKDGQSVPVGVGQPTLRVDGLTVGGTETG